MTTIKFIGLFILIYTQNVGYRILFPQFTGMPTDHPSYIAYAVTDRVAGDNDWPVTGDVPGMTGWQYVTVNREFITFAGSTDGVPAQVNPPHLTCCCQAMTGGIQAEYLDPNLPPTSKKGAQVEVDRGVSSLQSGGDGTRLDTYIKMTTGAGTVGVTVTGTLGAGNVKNIYFKPGATVVLGNTPFCAISNSCASADADFVMYYTTAKNPNTCIGTPSNCDQCATSASSCTTSSCANAAIVGGKKPLTMAQRMAAAKARRKQGPPVATINIDCSNSQYP